MTWACSPSRCFRCRFSESVGSTFPRRIRNRGLVDEGMDKLRLLCEILIIGAELQSAYNHVAGLGASVVLNGRGRDDCCIGFHCLVMSFSCLRNCLYRLPLIGLNLIL